MAMHSTHKSGGQGRALTLARKAARQTKYAACGVNADGLVREGLARVNNWDDNVTRTFDQSAAVAR